MIDIDVKQFNNNNRTKYITLIHIVVILLVAVLFSNLTSRNQKLRLPFVSKLQRTKHLKYRSSILTTDYINYNITHTLTLEVNQRVTVEGNDPPSPIKLCGTQRLWRFEPSRDNSSSCPHCSAASRNTR